MNVQEIASNNRGSERSGRTDDAIRELFGEYTIEEYQFISRLKITLAVGLKKERLAAAKELTRLADLYKANEIFVTKKDLEVTAGTLEEIISFSGYASVSEYVELANQAIEEMYNKEVIHYSKTITDANSLLPLSETNAETATNNLELRMNVERELNIVDCMYATTSRDLENIYGKNILKIDTQKYDILYHLGDTLASFNANCRYAQKPFKKGEFDVFASKFIPLKERLTLQGADAFCYHTAGYGFPVVEVLLKRKIVTSTV